MPYVIPGPWSPKGKQDNSEDEATKLCVGGKGQGLPGALMPQGPSGAELGLDPSSSPSHWAGMSQPMTPQWKCRQGGRAGF